MGENPDLITCGVVFHPSMGLEQFAFGGSLPGLMKSIKCPFMFAPASGDLPMFAEDGEFGAAVKESAKGGASIWHQMLRCKMSDIFSPFAGTLVASASLAISH